MDDDELDTLAESVNLSSLYIDIVRAGNKLLECGRTEEASKVFKLLECCMDSVVLESHELSK